MSKVSVIMGIYNCGSTLQEALDSLYVQTFQDFEIVMCDDGSTDNTYQVALHNKNMHPEKIKLLRNDRNLGLNQTLNNCLFHASGRYIARMDGDDISLPDRFEREVQFLDTHHEYAIISGPMIYFDEHGEFRRGRAGGEVTKMDFLHGSPFCHAPCMVRKEAYDTVNGYTVSPKLLRVEDYHLWFKMYAAGFKGWNLSTPIYAMRDDRNARKRRIFKNRINALRLQLWGYRKLGIPFVYWIFAIRPILVGILPAPLYNILHKNH